MQLIVLIKHCLQYSIIKLSTRLKMRKLENLPVFHYSSLQNFSLQERKKKNKIKITYFKHTTAGPNPYFIWFCTNFGNLHTHSIYCINVCCCIELVLSETQQNVFTLHTCNLTVKFCTPNLESSLFIGD